MEIDLQWEEQTSEMEKRWVNQCVYWWLCVFEIIDRKMQNIYIFPYRLLFWSFVFVDSMRTYS